MIKANLISQSKRKKKGLRTNKKKKVKTAREEQDGKRVTQTDLFDSRRHTSPATALLVETANKIPQLSKKDLIISNTKIGASSPQNATARVQLINTSKITKDKFESLKSDDRPPKVLQRPFSGGPVRVTSPKTKKISKKNIRPNTASSIKLSDQDMSISDLDKRKLKLKSRSKKKRSRSKSK